MNEKLSDAINGLVLVAFFAIAAVGTPSLAISQESSQVRFSPGATSATIEGTVRGNEYLDYVLNARGGQIMVVTLSVTDSNGHGSVFFNILPAGRDYPALYNGSTDIDKRAEVTLPSDGNWAIRVYQMGNDADTGKVSGYSINVSIAPDGERTGTDGKGIGASGAAMLPEEDFFVVRLARSDGLLNVRNAPRASGRVLGQIADGSVVRNVGGCTVSDGQQWCKVQPTSGGANGWVAARFLALPTPGSEARSGHGAPTASAGSISEARGEQVCQRALADFHGTDDVLVIGSEPYQGGGRFVRASVFAGRGGKREIWQCIASRNGVAGELQYLSADADDSPSGSSGNMPNAAEQACLRDVTRETNNPDVTLLRSSFSQAGTEVIVGVGPNRAHWRCIAYRDGSTAGIQFMGSEGAL